MTQAGFVLGTPYYMAPEQVLGSEISPQVDVYAFGILLFELMTGTRPVSGDTVERIFYSILNQPLDLAPLQIEGMPAEIPALIAKCTAKKADERPAGFGPVIVALEQAIGQLEARTVTTPMPAHLLPTEEMPRPRASPPQTGGRPAYLVPVAALAGVLLLAAIYLVVRPKPVPATESATPSTGRKAAAVLAPTLATSTGEMVLIPAGDFLFGEKKEKMVLPAYYIDRTEVTNSDYAAFCRATGHTLPEGFARLRAELPVVNVTVRDAQAYADWAGKRLPKEAEWEKAARGVDGRNYPWGDAADASRANVGTHAPRPANGFPQGASPYGVLQMVGNAWEFIDQTGPPSDNTLKRFLSMTPPATRDEPWYVIRGQSCGEPLLPTVIWDSTMVPARWKDRYLGFRCAKDAR
jgi:serine/threonine-protein kinase